MSDLRIVPPGMKPADGWQMQLKKGRGEALRPSIHNAMVILENDPDVHGCIRFNDVTKDVEVAGRFAGLNGDMLPIELSKWTESKYDVSFPVSIVADSLRAVAHRNLFDPLKEYLRGLVWDEVPRLDTFLEVYFGVSVVESDPVYVRGVSRRWLISMVARALKPGCKVDAIVILEGKQGTRKSTALRVLAYPYFMDSPITWGDRDAMMVLARNWLVELGELASLRRAEVEKIKQFLSSGTDQFRAPYGRTLQTYPRRSVFVGTTNSDSYLQDVTGNRRFWPICCGNIDIEALTRDRDQLFAEAVCLFDGGEQWWLTEVEDALADAETLPRFEEDSWTAEIEKWLGTPPGASPTTSSILTAVFKLDSVQHDQPLQSRVIRIMRRLGYTTKGPRVHAQSRIWRKK